MVHFNYLNGHVTICLVVNNIIIIKHNDSKNTALVSSREKSDLDLLRGSYGPTQPLEIYVSTDFVNIKTENAFMSGQVFLSIVF